METGSFKSGLIIHNLQDACGTQFILQNVCHLQHSTAEIGEGKLSSIGLNMPCP